MRKVFTSLLAVWALAFGLVTVTGEAATAGCPYSGCITTTTSVGVQIRPGYRARIQVSVSAPGNVAPRGTLSVTVTGRGRVKYHADVPYAGGVVAFATGRLRKGRYVATVIYTPAATSVFTGSHGSAKFKVKKRRT